MRDETLKSAIAELDAELAMLEKKSDQIRQAKRVLQALLGGSNGTPASQTELPLSGNLTALSQPVAVMAIMPTAPERGLIGREVFDRLIKGGKQMTLGSTRTILCRKVRTGELEKVDGGYRKPARLQDEAIVS